MSSADYLAVLRLAMPEAILTLAALGVLFVDLVGMRGVDRRERRWVGAAIALLGCFAAAGWLIGVEARGVVGRGMLVMDPLTRLVQVALVGLTAFTAWISVDSDFTEHVGEYYALLLLGTIGMLFLAGTENLLMLFVALELTSVALYVLTAFNKLSPRSAEAALKYFLFGSMAAAFTLYGLSLIYGLTGSLELRTIAARLTGKGLDPLLAAAIVLTVMGLGFKVAAAPFHLWAPDAYQGAPAPCAAFIASGSKVAGFFILAKMLMLGFAEAPGRAAWPAFERGWIPLIAAIAVASMVLGNLGAIVQTSVKRLLAYSAVAHAGYALLGVAADTLPGLSGLLYYVITYAMSTLGAFAVITRIEDAQGEARLADFAGLSRRAPGLSLCLTVFLLSLAGIPPFAGFFGKFYVFTAAVASGPAWLGPLGLVGIAIALSAVSLYYYLQVLKWTHVCAPVGDGTPLETSLVFRVGVALLALGVVVLGCVPGLLVGPLTKAIVAAGF